MTAEVTENNGESEEAKKKKKKKRKPKDKGGVKQQTDPPSIPVAELFPDGNFPVGQVMIHGSAGIDDRMAKMRFTSEEARALDRMHNDIYNEARQAAEAHRQTRKHIMKWVCKSVLLRERKFLILKYRSRQILELTSGYISCANNMNRARSLAIVSL